MNVRNLHLDPLREMISDHKIHFLRKSFIIVTILNCLSLQMLTSDGCHCAFRLQTCSDNVETNHLLICKYCTIITTLTKQFHPIINSDWLSSSRSISGNTSEEAHQIALLHSLKYLPLFCFSISPFVALSPLLTCLSALLLSGQIMWRHRQPDLAEPIALSPVVAAAPAPGQPSIPWV